MSYPLPHNRAHETKIEVGGLETIIPPPVPGNALPVRLCTTLYKFVQLCTR
jgi:hypothetical protein